MKVRHIKLVVVIIVSAVSLTTSVADAKLITHWKLDEKTGSTVADSSGNNNTGTLHGRVIWAPTEGKFEGAARFGQTDNDYVEIPLVNLSTSQGTISLWCNLGPDPQPGHHRYLFGHTTSPHMSNRIQLYLYPEDLRLNSGLGDSHRLSRNNKNFQPGIWYHIALTWDHNNYVLYIDGLLITSGDYTGLDNFNSIADIGNDGRNDGIQRDESFYGMIDDVTLFDHALNPNEVMQLYNGAGDCFVSETFLTLLDNIRQVEEFDKTSSPHEVVSFLTKKIAEYHRWEKRNPDEIGPHHKRLSCELYFLLAKAKEAAKAPTGEIIEAYKQSVSQLQFRRNYVSALLWLYENISARDFVDTVKKSAGNSDGTTCNLHRIAMDFEASGNWDAFELFLDAVFSKINNSTAFATAMAKGLSKDGLWADNFSRYIQNKPKLIGYHLEVCEKHALENIAQSDFIKAAGIYRDISNHCSCVEDKNLYKLKAYECIFEAGEYNIVLGELDDFIEKNRNSNSIWLAKAMALKGHAYVQLGETERALNIFSKIVKEYPESEELPEASFFIGYCNMLDGRFEEAQEILDSVIKNYPPSSYSNKSNLCIKMIEGK